jgi:SpoVK/Ycf46/Vps4 family AAA+-type ATPase
MCLRLKHHYTVYEAWGLGGRAISGRGVSALFAGPSGTGKTMAAEIVAHDLGQEAYRIDLSALVSKYIGETEKNLSKVFDAAEHSNAVLFFDEADALFGKRSDVKDAHDRYANIQVAYLLQRIERYSGVAILATNLKANTDEAFIRRIDFLVEFPFPEIEDRARIWRKLLSSPLPCGSIDVDGLAEKFRVTGGVIKNAVVQAAFLAAEDGTTIETSHLLHALRREYQKMGRLTSEIEAFSPIADRTNRPKAETRVASNREEFHDQGPRRHDT